MPETLSFPVDGQPVHFVEAIKAAEARQVVLPEVYYGQLQGVARQQAFSIAGIASYDQLKAVKDSLVKALRTGKTFKQWQREQAVKDLNLPKYRLEAIFRTNLQSNYQAGRWEQIQRNKHNRPYVMYDAINDARTRPAHAAMDGIIRPVDDPFWLTHKPINGINCRCGVISLSEAEAQARSRNGKGLNKPIDEEAMRPDPGFDYPDPGFDYPAQNRLAGIEQAVAKRQAQEGVLLSSLNLQLNQTMKVINLTGFVAVQQTLTKLAEQKSDWFPQGFNGIYAVSNPELFAGFDPKTAVFYLSTADELVPGFKPAYELQDALEKIKAGNPLTFNNEYAIETLWHEMMHGMTGITSDGYPLNREPFEEGIIQLASRYSYHTLVSHLKGKAIHQDNIISQGIAYPEVTKNLRYLFETAGITRYPSRYAPAPRTDLVHIVMDNAWMNRLKEIIATNLSISQEKVKYLFNQAEAKSFSAFKAKMDAQIRNAQSNKDAS